MLVGPCHQPCTGIDLCQVQHCKTLRSPFPPSQPSCLPLLLAGIFSAVTTSSFASTWIPLCAPGVPFPGCCPPGWPMGVPQFPPALGNGGVLHPVVLKRTELTPRCFHPNRALLIPISSLETCYAIRAIPGKCSCRIYLPGCRGFQTSSSQPFPSIHMLEARLIGFVGSNRAP